LCECLQSFANIEVDIYDATRLIKKKFPKDCFCFVMPPGEDLKYVEKLNGKGNKIIKEYVENGGAYFGICAGAYYACEEIDFWGHHDLHISGKRELGFYKGKAIGSLRELGGERRFDDTYRSAGVVDLQWGRIKRETSKVYYHGGPKFVSNGEGAFELLGGYVVNGMYAPALVKTNVGKGMAILSSPHIEMNHKYLDKSKSRNDMELAKYIQHKIDLEENEEGRKKVWDFVMSEIKRHAKL